MNKEPVFASSLDRLQEDHKFEVYSSGSSRNILFIGSCRMTPLAYYMHILYPVYNIYLIYLPYWSKEKREYFRHDVVDSFLPNTKLIITENARSFDFLNTDADLADNFFSKFNAGHCDQVMIPNLELHMYTADIHFLYKHDRFDEYKDIFLQSRERLSNSIRKSDFGLIDKFIESNLKNIRLFSTFSHPNRILSLLTFKVLIEKLNFEKKQISIENLSKLFDISFLEGHVTPIVDNDIDLYGFKFASNVMNNSIIYEEDRVQLQHKYGLSCDIINKEEYIEMIMESNL